MPILSRKDLERISRRVLFRYLTLSDRKMDRIDRSTLRKRSAVFISRLRI